MNKPSSEKNRYLIPLALAAAALLGAEVTYQNREAVLQEESEANKTTLQAEKYDTTAEIRTLADCILNAPDSRNAIEIPENERQSSLFKLLGKFTPLNTQGPQNRVFTAERIRFEKTPHPVDFYADIDLAGNRIPGLEVTAHNDKLEDPEKRELYTLYDFDLDGKVDRAILQKPASWGLDADAGQFYERGSLNTYLAPKYQMIFESTIHNYLKACEETRARIEELK
jgi:hypothetical protein